MKKSAFAALVLVLGAWISGPSAGQEEKKVKAVVYEVYVFDSALDMTHRAGHWIKEVYVPEAGIAFNVAKGLNVFKTGKERYDRPGDFGSQPARKIREIELPQKELGVFLEILKLQEQGKLLAAQWLEGR